MRKVYPDRTDSPLTRVDIRLAVLVGASGALLAWAFSLLLVFTESHLDVWFESDSVYILSQLSDRMSEANQSNGHHPLYPLIGFPIGARVLLLTAAALFTSAMFTALRLLGRPRPLALLLTALLVATSPGLLFLGVHERHVLGGATALLSVVAVLAWRRAMVPGWVVTAAAVLSLGITITNFMTTCLLLVAVMGFRKGARVAAIAFAIVLALSLITVATFPRSTVFPYPGTWPWFSSFWTDLDDVRNRAGSLAQKSTAFWLHSMVMPEPRVETKLVAEPVMRYVSFQQVAPARHSPIGFAALAAWLTCLASGLLLALRQRDPIDLALAAALAVQWLLFLVFGEETVLYSPYYVPIAVLLASKAIAGRWNDWGIRLAFVVMIVLLTWNNIQSFVEARDTALTLL
jgi:hypothetical protein